MDQETVSIINYVFFLATLLRSGSTRILISQSRNEKKDLNRIKITRSALLLPTYQINCIMILPSIQ